MTLDENSNNEGCNMADRARQATKFVEQQLSVLEELSKTAMTSLNAVLAKERLHKWKHYVVTEIAEKVGSEPAQRLRRDWLETPYAPDDIFEEFKDDVDMCRRHLQQLLADLRAQASRDEREERSSLG